MNHKEFTMQVQDLIVEIHQSGEAYTVHRSDITKNRTSPVTKGNGRFGKKLCKDCGGWC